MYIDSHAHLFKADYGNELHDVIQRAADAGVESIVVPATNISTSREAIELAERHSGVYVCVGIHPHEAAKAASNDLDTVADLLSHPKVVGIGEIGLDYYYDFAPQDVQVGLFKDQVKLAIETDYPIVIHTRDSIAETMGIVEEIIGQDATWRMGAFEDGQAVRYPRGVFHCFSGNESDAWRVINMGFYVSYPGIVTFKKSPVLTTLERIGYDHLLLETDSPYMSPVPYRGKRNEPAHIGIIAERIAEIVDASKEDVARATRFNSKRLFGIGEPDEPCIAYQLRNSLYLNITIRCNADCVFCDRKGAAIVKGYSLRIAEEPSLDQIIASIGNPLDYEEVVFCGYGEPTIRLDVMKDVARWVKSRGGRVRLNTDGHGNIINKRNIVPELVGLVDVVSISYNTSDPEQYGRLMRIDGKRFHQAMIEFTRECKRLLPRVVMTIVELPEVDIEKARKDIEETLGCEFKLRPYF
ncbi:MAG: YchF/TatD family DNA exonuclease [Ignavibacteria bacterium]|nr:YchF/TatD family DNA exonuclease [Ignavibacteria bacterium]